jgi:hypothetical protein
LLAMIFFRFLHDLDYFILFLLIPKNKLKINLFDRFYKINIDYINLSTPQLQLGETLDSVPAFFK